ncbi:Putrescine-binding periplasmic protein precursor [Pseudomonas sp. IsoF]|nr:Putrescine-binding periplasmic protein precursor [Pseudomonas sp. IsoF]
MRRSLCLLSVCLALPLQAQEKVVNLYSWADYVAPQTLQRFERETGYKVRYDTFDTTEVLETKLLTGAAATMWWCRHPPCPCPQGQCPAAARSPGHAGLCQPTRTAGNAAGGCPIGGRGECRGRTPAPGRCAAGQPRPVVQARVRQPPEGLRYRHARLAAGSDRPDLELPGKDPYSQDKTDLAAAQKLLNQLQPSIRYVANGRQISDLANGSVCLALTYGDAAMAADQARRAGKPFELIYRIPQEGTVVWQDNLVIPRMRRTLKQPGRSSPSCSSRSRLRLTNTLFFAMPIAQPRPWWTKPCATTRTSTRLPRYVSGCMPTAAWRFPTCANATACGWPFAPASKPARAGPY